MLNKTPFKPQEAEVHVTQAIFMDSRDLMVKLPLQQSFNGFLVSLEKIS